MLRNNLKLVRNSVDAGIRDIETSVHAAAREMQLALTQLAKQQIKGRRPEGQRATAGESPMNRTGTLRRPLGVAPFTLGSRHTG